MWKFLKGKKTFILTALGAAGSIFGFVPSVGITALIPLLLDFITSPAMQELLTYGSIAAVRSGMSAVK